MPIQGGAPTTGAPRTVSALMAARCRAQAKPLPVGMPTGPWTSDEAAKAELTSWARDPKTGGGGWGLNWGSHRKGNGVRGQQHVLACHSLKSSTCCKWSLKLEECVEGWVIWSLTEHAEGIVHSHPLTQSTPESNAYSGMRSIPKDLLDVAKVMAASGIACKDIVAFLKHSVLARGEEVTFTYHDVYHATCATTAARAMDATNMVELLRQREQDQNLFFRTTTDTDGCLDKV